MHRLPSRERAENGGIGFLSRRPRTPRGDRALQAEGVPVTLREVDGAVHGFTVLPIAKSKATMAEIRDFVLEHLPA